MNYIDVYNKITLNRKDLPKETYGEIHHIWPRSLGGGNEPVNLVRLTAKEHYVAHHLLTKIFPDSREMVYAFNLMCGTMGSKSVYVSPRVYAEARENFAKAQLGHVVTVETRSKISTGNLGKPKSDKHRAHLSEAQRGKTRSEETRAKMSAARRGANHPMCGRTGENSPLYGRRHSAESIEKMCAAQSGKTLSATHRAKLSAAMSGANHPNWGKTLSADTREKIREANKGLQCGEKHPSYDHTLYRFIHPERGERICTQYELRVEFGLNSGNLSSVVLGKLKTTGGWRCLGEAE